MSRSTWLMSALGGTMLATGWVAWQPGAEPPEVISAVVRSPGTGSGATPRGASVGVPATLTPSLELPAEPVGVPDPIGIDAAADPLAASVREDAPRRGWGEPSASALAAWTPAAPPEAAPSRSPSGPAAPEPVVAPAFPYQWIGGMEDGDGAVAFLASPRRTAAVRPGETLDAVWRFDATDADGRLRFTWIPGNLPVTLEPRR